MPETTYNPSITVDTGLYCPVCRGAIQANLTDSSVGPIVWDVFCEGHDGNVAVEAVAAHRNPIFVDFAENVATSFGFDWARGAWDNYHSEKAEAIMEEHSFLDRNTEAKNA